MNKLPKTHLHQLEKASALESRLRLLRQNPRHASRPASEYTL